MGTHYQGSKTEINALNTFIKFVRAAESINSRLNARLVKEGLTVSQFGILEALLHLGPLCQKELADKILKSGGNITMVIDNLEKQGFVKRERGEKDRRLFTIHLTAEGRNLIERVFPGHVKAIVDEMNVLSEVEQIELQRMSKIIGMKNLQNNIVEK